jgi:hypothetical protein
MGTPELGPTYLRLAAASLLALSCHAGATNLPVGPAASPACIVRGNGEPRETLTVALAHGVDAAHAPVPRNESERLVFRQLYETLVTVDCEGQVRAGLAESWTEDAGGRSWTFRIRGDVQFADGSPLTARDVVASWPSTSATHAIGLVAVTVGSDRELTIELQRRASSPAIFADPVFAVAKHVGDDVWPFGTRAVRAEYGSGGSMTRLASAERSVEFHSLQGSDPRGALDAGVDLVVSADEGVIQYARALTGYRITPLPWNVTYVMMSRVGAGDVTLGALRSLASDAVRADARPAEPPYWWIAPECTPPGGERPDARRGPSKSFIAYPQDDAVSRGIAERLVSLSWPPERSPDWLRARLPVDDRDASAPSAKGMTLRALIEAVRGGEAAAVIVPLPRSPVGTCPVPSAASGDELTALLLRSAEYPAVTPLLDGRLSLIAREGVGDLAVDGDGALLLTGRVW